MKEMFCSRCEMNLKDSEIQIQGSNMYCLICGKWLNDEVE